MNNKILHSIMFVIMLVALYVPSSFSQYSSTLTLMHDTWDGHKIYTVDIYVQSTNGSTMELATQSIGLLFPDAERNGGTITASFVAGSSGLSNTAQINTSFNAAATTTIGGVVTRIIKIASRPLVGAGAGSVISNVAPGTRIGTLKLANTVDWVISGTNAWGDLATAATGYASGFNIYVYDEVHPSGFNTNEQTQQTFVKNLAGPLLPVELSSFASAVQGRSIVLNWSTKTEKNSNRFDVERSLVSVGTWSTVASVKASVLSNSTKEYSYSDTKLQSGKYQYRLKMIDNDGSFSYSSVEAAEVAIPKDFQVSQNYPNPFNPSTKIDYQVPVDAKVLMEVYNIAGQKVFELVNQNQSAGYYTVDFGASKLSSGVYIYRLAAVDATTGNNFSSIKKMMLLK